MFFKTVKYFLSYLISKFFIIVNYDLKLYLFAPKIKYKTNPTDFGWPLCFDCYCCEEETFGQKNVIEKQNVKVSSQMAGQWVWCLYHIIIILLSFREFALMKYPWKSMLNLFTTTLDIWWFAARQIMYWDMDLRPLSFLGLLISKPLMIFFCHCDFVSLNCTLHARTKKWACF